MVNGVDCLKEGNIERTLWIILAIYVCILPIAHMGVIRGVCVAALLGLTIAQRVRQRILLDFPLYRSWLLYAAVALISLTYAVDPWYSLREIRAEIFFPIMISVIGASWIREEGSFKRLMVILVIGNLLFILGSAWALLRAGRIGDGIGGWGTGVGNASTMIVMIFPWLLVQMFQLYQCGKTRGAAALAVLLTANLAALFMTLNRQGWIALAASLVLMAFLAKREFWTRRRIASSVALLVLITIIGLAGFQMRSTGKLALNAALMEAPAHAAETDVRWRLWQFSAARIAEHPWIGGGFGREALRLAYPDFYKASSPWPFWHAHNMVINKGIQMGIPGIASFLWLWVMLAFASVVGLRSSVFRPWSIAILGMLAGAFLKNMTDDFFYRHNAYLFWLLCGAYLGTLRHGQKIPDNLFSAHHGRAAIT